MATQDQIDANRINAQKCCGPTSTAGLAVSSQNALKTGIYSKAEVTRNESRDEYHDLTIAFHERFAPATPDEISFVDALITHEWLSRRYRRADTATWEKRFDQIEEVDVGRVFNERADQFTKAGRLYNASRRGFNSTLKELRQAQTERTKAGLGTRGSFTLPSPAVTAVPSKPLAPPEPPATEPRLEEAVLKPTPAKPLNPELVSFHHSAITVAPVPGKAPETDPKKEVDPPIAA